MDDVPQVSSGFQIGNRSKGRFSSFGLFLPLLFLFGLTSAAFSESEVDRAPIARVTVEEAQKAENNKVSATLQISFPTVIYDRGSNVLAELRARVVERFPGLKLNTIGRQWHVTTLYLDDLSMDEARSLTRLLQRIDRPTLEKYGLLERVQFLDPDNIELKVLGTKSKFLALTPHADFVKWQVGFYQMLKELAENPEFDSAKKILERHVSHGNLGSKALDADSVHMSLVQWGRRFGIPLSDGEVTALKIGMKDLIEDVLVEYVARHNEAPRVDFSLREHPLELVTAPASIKTPPPRLVTFRDTGHGGLQPSEVGRWPFSVEKTGMKSMVEFWVRRWMRADGNQFAKLGERVEYVDGLQHHTPVAETTFTRLIQDKRVRESWSNAKERGYISSSIEPAEVTAKNLFFTSQPHPKLAPEKAHENDIMPKLRRLQLRSTDRISTGTGIYASSVRGDIKHPGDYDASVLGLAYVGDDEAETYEDAVERALDMLYEDLFEKQLFPQLTPKGGLGYLELIFATEGTLYGTSDDKAGNIPEYERDFESLQRNVVLSYKDIQNRSYTDRDGNVRTIREMLSKRDFVKGKVDLIYEGKREEISLQFLLGFKWRGETYAIQTHGLKGIPPLTRTQVYDGADSYAIASILARPYDLSSLQRGDVTVRVIRDVLGAAYKHTPKGDGVPIQERMPAWNTKFLKKFYNMLIFFSQSGGGLLEAYIESTIQAFDRAHLVQGRNRKSVNVHALIARVQSAINQDALKFVNETRRNVNDFAELNERRQRFTREQLLHRYQETVKLIPEIKKLFKPQNGMRYKFDPDFLASFEKALSRFEDVFSEVSPANLKQGVEVFFSEENYEVFADLELWLYHLEGQIVTRGERNKVITEVDQEWIKTAVDHSVEFIWRYRMARDQDSPEVRRWLATYLGVEPTETNLKALDQLALYGASMEPKDYSEVMDRLLTSNPCQKDLE